MAVGILVLGLDGQHQRLGRLFKQAALVPPVLLLGLMFAFYYIPEVSVKIGLTLPLTTAGWAVIIVMFFVWAAVMILSLKAKFLRKLNEWGNEIVLRYFIRLFEKENAKEAKAISDEENDQ